MRLFILIGDILTNVFYLLPLQQMIRLLNGCNEDLGITPYFYTMMFTNSLSWTIYSFLLMDFYMIASIILGLILSFFYSQVVLTISSNKKDLIVSGTYINGGIIIFSLLKGFENIKDYYGVISTCTELIMLIIPLIGIIQGSSVILWIAMMTIINSGLWLTYGVITKDIFLTVPNIITLGSGISQIGIWMYRKTKYQPEINQVPSV